ncbi:MAG: selenocysteine-specific translation elongation factor [Planctomycetes bacterium RBG_16_64_10]|nr:MAG: selenocysteine-specific translation elongation factor [Planctomycetes bacterium RBG_16_64_10]
MPSAQVNVTLGTAGHIDHGKTALVKCLTGCDTDRLKAEKERGMSIDLGFAPCTIAGVEVGIVDVPGHENFIKTMVAGANGMDAVVLVVAADDGVMPQTREHLDILTLLGVQQGLVALTKIDRVEPDHLELVRIDIEGFLQGTFLEGAAIVPVSSVTGEGFEHFYEALAALLRAIRPKPIDGVFRLPLDRAFSAKGHGTVVAGVPVSGSARVDDEVVLLPHGKAGRIRAIEVYGRSSDTVMAGQCAALNVRDFDHRSISRGNTVTVPGYFALQPWYACSLRLLPHKDVSLKNGAVVKLHTGTTEVSAAIYAMKADQLRSGEDGLVQIRTNTPIVAGPGDRFILRTLSPIQTVGGGMIIETIPRKLKRNHPHVYEDLQERAQAVVAEDRFVEYCVKTAQSGAASTAELAIRAKLPLSRARDVVTAMIGQGKVIALAPGTFMHRDTAADACRRILALVADFHRQSPERVGIATDQLRADAQLDKNVYDGMIALLTAERRLVERNGRLAASEHRVAFRAEDSEHIAVIEAMFRQQTFHPPGLDEVVQKTGATAATVQRHLGILREYGTLVQVADGLLFHHEAVDRARDILSDFFGREEKLESVRFKYLLDTTRKFALPLLDYFDRVGVTRRVGNTRYAKTPPGHTPAS